LKFFDTQPEIYDRVDYGCAIVQFYIQFCKIAPLQFFFEMGILDHFLYVEENFLIGYNLKVKI